MALTATFGTPTDETTKVTIPVTVTTSGNPCSVHVLSHSSVQILSRQNKTDTIDLIEFSVFCEGANQFSIVAQRIDDYCGGFAVDIEGYAYCHSSNTMGQVISAEAIEIPPPKDAPTPDFIFPDELKCVSEVPFEIRWSEPITEFDLSDIVATYGAQVLTISNLEKVTDQFWTASVGLPNETTGTLTLRIHSQAVMGEFLRGPDTDYIENFNFDTSNTTSVTIENTTTLCEEVHTFADNPIFTGAFNNVLELLVHGGYAYFIVQIVRDSGGSPNNTLRWDLTGASALMRVLLSGGECELIHRWDDVLAGGRSLCVYNNVVYVFVGSHYLYQFEGSNRSERSWNGDFDYKGVNTDINENPNWRDEFNNLWRGAVGEIWRVEGGASITLEFVGKTGRTGQSQHISTTEEDYDPHYGVRGSTVSPMIAAGGELYHVAGWGDTRDIGRYLLANSVVDDIRNWQFAKLTETLSERIPALLTNDRTGWDVLQELGILTHSRIGWQGSQFRFEGIAPRSAKLTDAVTDTSMALLVDSYSHAFSSYPNTGIVYIQAELIAYSGLGSGGLTVSQRGAYETTADGYSEDQTVLWIDHVIEEYLSLSISNDPSQIHNVIKINYGIESEFEVIDENSVEYFGRRELVLELPLSDEQTVWAEYIADTYLSLLKSPQTIVSVSVALDVNIEIGQTVFLRQVERGHLYGAGQVIEVSHDLIQSQTTAIKLKML